jgi:hypothetical protein
MIPLTNIKYESYTDENLKCSEFKTEEITLGTKRMNLKWLKSLNSEHSDGDSNVYDFMNLFRSQNCFSQSYFLKFHPYYAYDSSRVSFTCV